MLTRNTRVSVIGLLVLLAGIFAPAHSRAGNLEYLCTTGQPNGVHAQVVIIYWGWYDSSGNWSDPLGEAPVVESFVRGIGGTRYWNTLTQYYQSQLNCASPEVIQNATVPIFYIYRDYSSQPGLAPTQDAEWAEVDGVAAVLGNPDPANTIYILAYPRSALPPGMQGDEHKWICGYHDRTRNLLPIGDPNRHQYVAEPYFEAFGARPDFAKRCGGVNTTYGAITQLAQHELAESITYGWTENAASLQEIGDLCEGASLRERVQLGPSSDPNGRVNIQPLWSNAAQRNGGACAWAWATRSDYFVLGTDGNVYRELVPNSSYESWGGPTSSIVAAPAAVSHDPGYVDLFVHSANGHIYQAYTQDSAATHHGWYDWGAAPSPYSFYGKVSVASWGSNRIDLFVGGQSSSGARALFHRSWDAGVATAWTQIPVSYSPASSPAATSWGPSRIDVVQVGADGVLHQLSSLDGTSFTEDSWAPPGTTLTGDPDIGSHLQGYLDAFVGDIGGQIWHAYQYPSAQAPGGRVHGWDTLPNPPSVVMRTPSNPSVVGMGDYRLRVNVTDTNGASWANFYDYSWSGWQQVLWNGGSWYGGATTSW